MAPDYGWIHRRARERALRGMKDGAPCVRCGNAMYRRDAALLDLDHREDGRGYRGLAHRGCNRSAGQAKAIANARARKAVKQRIVNSRIW